MSVEELEHLLAELLAAVPAAEAVDDFVAHATSGRKIQSFQYTKKIVQKDIGAFLRGEFTDPGHRIL